MERLRKLWRGRTVTFGVPLLLYLVGGSFGLREFAQIRYDVHKLHGKAGRVGLSLKSNGDKLWLISLSVEQPGAEVLPTPAHTYHLVSSWKKNETKAIQLVLMKPGDCQDQKTYLDNLKQVDPALKEKLKQNTVTLESEYEKLKGADLDNWENIRGPRLWEDSRTVQQQRREAARLKRE